MGVVHKLLLYLHILSAIASIGPFFVFIPIAKKLRTSDSAERLAYIDTFKFAIRLAKHAGHVLVVSGVLLVMIGSWSWNTSWIVMTVIILLGSLFFLARAFSPKLRDISKSDHDREKSIKALHRSIWIYLTLLLAMLWFMVFKPALW